MQALAALISTVGLFLIILNMSSVIFGSGLTARGEKNYAEMKRFAKADVTEDVDAAIALDDLRFQGVYRRDRLEVQWIDCRCYANDVVKTVRINDFSQIPLDNYMRGKNFKKALSYISDYNHKIRRHLEKTHQYDCAYKAWDPPYLQSSCGIEVNWN